MSLIRMSHSYTTLTQILTSPYDTQGWQKKCRAARCHGTHMNVLYDSSMGRVTLTNESRLTGDPGEMSPLEEAARCHGTHMNVSCNTSMGWNTFICRDSHTNESWHTNECVIECRAIHQQVGSLIRMSHVLHDIQ